jgi:hypothetical protein
MSSKEYNHYFVVYGTLSEDGFVDWAIDTETGVYGQSPSHTVFNVEENQWETIDSHGEDDRLMLTELQRILYKDYDMGPSF